MINVRKTLVVGALLLFGAGLGFIGSRQMVRNSIQAEARLTLTYLRTLQEAHYLHSSNYTFFDSLYGAVVEGRDNCRQPTGASELGFALNWCHKENSRPIRYAYRLIKSEDGYRAQAYSGSDENLLSFVCFGSGQSEIWQIGKNQQIIPIKTC